MASAMRRTSLRAITSATSRFTTASSTRQCLAANTIRHFSSTRKGHRIYDPYAEVFADRPIAYEKRYTKDHEWIELSDDKTTGKIGVSEYAAKALGDVVYVELPETDLEVGAEDAIGAVESVKSASDIMTPISGTIIEVNKVLEDKPSTINQSPEADGWIAKIEVKDASELEALMDAEAYKKFTEEADEDH